MSTVVKTPVNKIRLGVLSGVLIGGKICSESYDENIFQKKCEIARVPIETMLFCPENDCC